LDGGQKRIGPFRIAGSDPSPPFEMQEGVLDQVPQLIQVLVIRPLFLAIFPRRDLHLHALATCLLHDGITVIAFIGQQVLGTAPLDQSASRRAIRLGT
jgi:hypothetical protein